MRILAVAELVMGGNSYAYVRAFRRLGHSVHVTPAEQYVPVNWRRFLLRAVRKLCEPVFVREYTEALVTAAERLRPHLFFVFKGPYVTPEAVVAIRRLGAVAVNFYPDVSFLTHGRYIPRALPRYDWVFTTKTFGLKDMEHLLNVRRASFLPHGYDPEVHRPVELDEEERARYECDVSFIGTWSPKKQKLLEEVCAALPAARVRVWGEQWQPARATLGSRVEGRWVLGLEYAKALVASKVSLGILSEARKGASSGDLITSRTFHIPATGAFMLHERTSELQGYFVEGKECGSFGDAAELAAKIRYYLSHPEERLAVAAAGRRRAVESGYAVDCRAEEVLKKVAELGNRSRAT
jgi:glycosyltransferase involved in cell wall biosynthesis